MLSARLPVIDASAALATFVAGLRFEDLPEPVVHRAEDLLVDWFGSALAGAAGRPVRTIVEFAESTGRAGGACEVLITRGRTSPMMAALANGASSHFAEQDDVHNGAVFHPGTVVFPAALAAAQETGATGRELLTAAVAGYEVGIRVGEFLGRSHYKVFHTTGTAGTVAAAAATARVLRLSPEATLHAFGSAGTQAAGLWEFLRDGADSKQLHAGGAAASGLMAAWLAKGGLTGARRILEGPQGMAAGMSSDADPARLVDGLGSRWTTSETSFKWHASCRHTHPAADALIALLRTHGLAIDRIESVIAHVHQAALDVLGPVTSPATVHQSKFSMGTVLAIAARFGHAGLDAFDREFLAPQTVAFRERVRMQFDPEVDAAYPRRWIGKVTVTTTDGRVLSARVDEPKGDPGNTLTRDEIERKAVSLAAYGGATGGDEAKRAVERLWRLARSPRVGPLLSAR